MRNILYILDSFAARTNLARLDRLGLVAILGLLVAPSASAVTGSLSPSNPVVGVTNVNLVGTATPNSTVTVNETAPDGTTGVFSGTANSSGNYSMGPYKLQQLGSYTEVLRDSSSGATQTIFYSGTGNFNISGNASSQSVLQGSSASFTITVSSVGGFTGTLNLTALNWSQIPGSTASWSPSASVSVPSNGSTQATFTIQTSAGTAPGTYPSIQLRGANGSFSATRTVSVTITAPSTPLTGSLSPSNPVVGVTNVSVVGTATPGATVTEPVETWPDGTTHGPFSTTANASGNYSLGPFILQQLGNYSGTLRDSISGNTLPIGYSGTGNFNLSVNTTSQTIQKGNAASYTVTASSQGGFAGTLNLAALNWSPQIPSATGSWSPSASVSVPSNGSTQTAFTIQTSASTTPGTYSNIQFKGSNGTFSATVTVSLTVTAPAATLTGSVSPGSPTVGVTNVSIVGTASPGATVTETTEIWPDGTAHGPYSTTANASGNYSLGPFILQQLGSYSGTLRDSITGNTLSITYTGAGNFSVSVNSASQTVNRGQAASFTATFSSVAGFAGTVIPAALNWSQVPGATASWSPGSLTIPSGGSAQATFTIQTSASTTAGTYSGIILQGANGSATRTASAVSVIVNAPAATLTGSISPSSPTVGVTNVSIVGTASPGATVTETAEIWPDGTVHGPYSTTVNASGNFTLGPFILQQLGNYSGTLRDSITGATTPITYSGVGDFNVSANATSQTVNRGQAASFTVTFNSGSGFAGAVVPAALNWSQIPGSTASWSPTQVTVPSGGSAQATFTIQTSIGTTAATYSNITLQGANGSVTRAVPSPVSVTVNAPTATLTGSLSPSSPTVGVTNANIVGTASPGATVTETAEAWPDGTTHGPYSTTANASGNYTLGPFILQQLGNYSGTLRDSISGNTIPISYSGVGNFTVSVNTTSQSVTKGQVASFTVTFSSVSGFGGTVVPAALNWSQIPGATASWSPTQVTVPSNSSAQTIFTIQTAANTTAGTYSNITVQGANGSVTRTASSPVSVIVTSATGTLTGSLSPSNPTVGVTNVNIVGTASPGAMVTETTETWPDGTAHGPYSTTANASGNYTLGPFILQQLGNYSGTLRDSISGATTPISYSGVGDFNVSVNATSQTVTRGQPASFVVTFSSVSGFAGTVVPAALNWSQIPGSTASWSPTQFPVPANGSAQATFTIQTAAGTTAGTYSNIALQGANGSATRGVPFPVSVIVNSATGTLTGAISPSSPTIGVTNANIVGTASPGATVTETTEIWPDGTTHGPYSTTANASGNYTLGPFILQQIGNYSGTLRDSISGSTTPISYSGAGDFSVSVKATSQTVTRGQPANFVVTFTSVSGFAGTVVPAALSWSQIPGSTASWSPTQVTVPANGSAQATFTIQTAAGTTAGTYSNITLQGANGSVTRTAPSQVSVIVNSTTGTLTGSISPSSPTVGLTNVTIVGTASPGATVTEPTETWPDGTTHGPFSTTANASGNYTLGPFILQQLGTYSGTLRDSISGTTTPITYSGVGNFSVSVSASSQAVNRGQAVSFTATFSSVSGFAGTVIPAALNWSQIPGTTASWSPTQVSVPSGGSAQATFTVQTSANTTSGSYGNIILQGANGSVTRAASAVGITVNGPAATLSLDVQPVETQAVSPGQAANYTMTVKDSAGAGVSGATAFISNPFTGTNITVTTGTGGTASYALPVPSSQAVASYAVSFWASKSSYTDSNTTSRQVTVLPPQSIGSPTIQTNPTSGPQGTTFNITGSGFTPNGAVRRFFQGPGSSTSQEIGTISADGSGQITWPWASSCSDAVGPWFAWTQDVAKNQKTRQVTETVTSAPSCVASVSIQSNPPSGPQGTTFTITGTGFTPNGTVRRLMTAPGQGQQEISSILADSSGSITWSYPSNCQDLTGTWTLSAIDGGKNKQSNPVTQIITALASCSAATALIDHADFVIDGETYKDGTVVPSGSTFTKQWILRNTGTTTWSSAYRLEFISGDAGCSHNPVVFSQPVAPNQSYTFTVACIAPTISGDAKQIWHFTGPHGTVQVGRSQTIWALITVPTVPIQLVATPSALTFQYQVGTSVQVTPQSVTLQSKGMDTSYSIQPSSSGGWLLASRTSASTPDSFTVSVRQTLAVGVYPEGSITITSPSAPTVIIPVTLKVTPFVPVPNLKPRGETVLVGSIDLTKDTIVLTHGLSDRGQTDFWTGTGDREAQNLIKLALGDKASTVNIVQFVWQEGLQVALRIPQGHEYVAAWGHARDAGMQLAAQLVAALGTEENYTHKIHFIGHSLGTIVNAYAAEEFLKREPNVQEVQFTALDRPDHIGNIPHNLCPGSASQPLAVALGQCSVDTFEITYGFDRDFFASHLPMKRLGSKLKVDNYYSLTGEGVGDIANGAVYNYLFDSASPPSGGLRNPGNLNHLIGVFKEGVYAVDHTGVQQWYRWTIFPHYPLPDGSSVCPGGNFSRENFPSNLSQNPLNYYNDSLNPCQKGWNWSILNSNSLPANNGPSPGLTKSGIFSLLNPADTDPKSPKCNVTDTKITCTEASSPYSAMQVNIPGDAATLSFTYNFANSGDGDYAAVVLDETPIWVLNASSAAPGVDHDTGPIPIKGLTGSRVLTVALYGVGAKNFSFSLTNFAVQTTPAAGPVLSVTKTHTGTFVQGQQGAQFSVSVSNTPGAPATSGAVTVTETLPPGLTLVSMTGSGWTCSASTCSRSDALAGGISYPGITVTVNVASNASSPQVNVVSVTGGGSASANTSDLVVIAGPTAIPTITNNGIVSAAGFKAGVTRGTVATIFGTSLASSPTEAASVPLPRNLGNVQVTVNGVSAPLWYVGSGQINFQVPFEAPLQGSASIVVTRDGVPSGSFLRCE